MINPTGNKTNMQNPNHEGQENADIDALAQIFQKQLNLGESESKEGVPKQQVPLKDKANQAPPQQAEDINAMLLRPDLFNKCVGDLETKYAKIEKEYQKFSALIKNIKIFQSNSDLKGKLLKELQKPLQELIDETLAVREQFENVDLTKIQAIEDKLHKLNELVAVLVTKTIYEIEKPISLPHTGLPNIGNSCYINSGIQFLRGGKFLENLMEQFRTKKTESERKQLIEAKHVREDELMVCLKLFVEAWSEKDQEAIDTALHGLRFALFESKDHSITFAGDNVKIDSQYDGSAVITSLLAVLGYNITFQPTRTVQEKFIFEGNELIDEHRCILAPVPENMIMLQFGSNKVQQFQNLLNKNFDQVEHKNDKANIYKKEVHGQLKFFDTYTDQPRMTLPKGAEPPKYLPIQMERFIQISEEKKKEMFDATYTKLKKEQGSELRQIAKDTIVKESKGPIPTGDVLEKLIIERVEAFLKSQTESAVGFDAIGAIKINEKVTLPENGVIDFSKVFGKDTALNYRLTSFEMHHGESTKSGHYTTYRLVDGHWHHFDDDKVSAVSQKEAFEKSSEAYILLFERI